MGQTQQKNNSTTTVLNTSQFVNSSNNNSEELTSPNSAHNHGDDFSKILAHNFSEKSPLTPKKGFDPFAFCAHEGFSLAKQGNWLRVEKMLKTKEATITDIDMHGNTMLYYSCLAGHMTMAKKLLDLGARDCKFSRCYLNSLSQGMRCLLKTYHNYSFSTQKKVEEDDLGVIEDDSLVNLLLSFVKRAIFSSEEENIDDPDMTLTLQFKGEQSPATYRLHKWILISRWPGIIEFALNENENPVQYPNLTQLQFKTLITYNLDPREYQRELLSSFSATNRPSVENVKTSIELAKQYLEEKFQPYQVPDLNEEQIENVYEKLSYLDLGVVPFSRKVFEVILTYIYTSKLIDPRAKSTFIPLEKVISREQEVQFVDELINAAYSLKLTNIARVLFLEVGIHGDFIARKFKAVKANLDNFQEARKKELQEDLSPLGYIFESKQPTNILDILRRKCCDMKIKLAESIDDEEQVHDQETEIILCHKKFVTKRSAYFDIITSCGFSEGIQFREEEERNGIATLEINCPNMEILTQLINYTYSENANITPSICIELAIQAQKLDYNVLFKKSEDFMIENLTIQDADMFELYKLANFLGSEKLKKFWKPQTIKYVANLIKGGSTTIEQVKQALLTELDCDEKQCETLLNEIMEKLDFC